MVISTRKLIHSLIFFLGTVLIVVGIATKTSGAWIIGLIVAAVNFHHWYKINTEQTVSDIDRSNG